MYWNETLYLSYISKGFEYSLFFKVFKVLQSLYRDFAEEHQSWTIITVKLFISIKYLIYTNCKGENQGERRENARRRFKGVWNDGRRCELYMTYVKILLLMSCVLHFYLNKSIALWQNIVGRGARFLAFQVYTEMTSSCLSSFSNQIKSNQHAYSMLSRSSFVIVRFVLNCNCLY